MKKRFNLFIETPDSQGWSDFTPTNVTGFGSTCKKEAVDFTELVDKEIIRSFNHDTVSISNRLGPTRGKSYFSMNGTNTKFSNYWIYTGLVVLSLLFINISIFAQTQSLQSSSALSYPVEHEGDDMILLNIGKSLKGVVVDELSQPLPGVNIYLKGTSIGTVSDFDGKFTFPKEVDEGDIVVFSSLGRKKVEYIVPEGEIGELKIELSEYIEILGELSSNQVYTDKTSNKNGLWTKIKGLF